MGTSGTISYQKNLLFSASRKHEFVAEIKQHLTQNVYCTAHGDGEKKGVDCMTRMFMRFFFPQIKQKLAKEKTDVELDGKSRNLT